MARPQVFQPVDITAPARLDEVPAEAGRTGLAESVAKQFAKAADIMGLDPNIRRILATTATELVVHFPVRLDDGRVEIFTGYRVQHNNILGPFKGGFRFHPSIKIDDVRALATLMTMKTAAANIPFGGASGGVQFDPAGYTPGELERITRRFIVALGTNIGPDYDIPAPDMNTNPHIMAWILDTYLMMMPPSERQRCTHVVTGKPVETGGSLGRNKAMAQSVVFMIEAWAHDHELALERATYALQGFGNVGSWVARLLQRRGAKLVAVEDVSGAIANSEGLDPALLVEHARGHAGVAAFPGCRAVDHETFFSTPVDIFIPAAMQNQITSATAPLISAKLVAEGANGATHAEADPILQANGIDLIPDIICNSGGVVVSYFEWLQNKRSEFWELDEVDGKLNRKIMGSYRRVRDTARTLSTDWRTAAWVVALSVLEAVYTERGIFP
jgi:glutamate dehydrogenase (NAD(P)+)